MRPLFLEFPHGEADGGPLDLSTGNAFMVGPDLLVAQSPYPDELDDYQVALPPSSWYDYWTGDQVKSGKPAGPVDLEQRDKVIAQKPLMVTPMLDQLPVYVRGGSILPIAPLTQSTSEMPTGPLILRVFPLTEGFGSQGEACAGEVYADDGHTLNFRNGEFARIHFSCSVAPDGAVTVQIAKQEGTWKPWWREYRVEVVGFTPKTSEATMNNQRLTMSKVEGRWGVVIPADASGSSIQLK